MPVIHVPLTDEEFIDFAIMARQKGLKRSDLASVIIREAMMKQEKMTPDEASTEFNRQGLPLAKRLKKQPGIYTDADGTPLVPMYERQ
jgi:hypothetical protein